MSVTPIILRWPEVAALHAREAMFVKKGTA
jgi:hypothetical protein